VIGHTNAAETSARPHCWLCGTPTLKLRRSGNLPEQLTPEDFRITDYNYGRTADVYRCTSCGFLECPTIPDVLSFYQEMDDDEYEATRAERVLQAKHLLKRIAAQKRGGTLLDVGAGSGIMVETALATGYKAEGIEPSAPLQRRAVRLDLPVHSGVLPSVNVRGPYDIVTLIDVIEHVPNPVELMEHIRDVMADDGICVVVTPDVRSLAARIMGKRWWHYRIAHIGYFDRKTLSHAFDRACPTSAFMRRIEGFC
jgi:SAM-dependent methyltransferase